MSRTTVAPAKHKKLAEHILAAGGALISEYPFGQAVRSQQYVKLDCTQAGLAQGVVMIRPTSKAAVFMRRAHRWVMAVDLLFRTQRKRIESGVGSRGKLIW